MKLTMRLANQAVLCAIASAAAWAQTPPTVDERDYVALNGRRVKIGSFGNLVAFQSAPGLEDINVKRSREGYILAYRLGSGPTRIVYNVHDVRMSESISPGSPDFVLESFTAPAASSGIPSDTHIRATSRVRTRDNAVRLIRKFDFTAGYGPVRVSVTVEALAGITVLSFKDEADLDVAGRTNNDCTRTPSGATCMALIDSVGPSLGPDCPPWEIDCNPNGLRAVPFTGFVPPSYVSIRRWEDESEHHSVGLVTLMDRAGYRANEDNQITLGWILNLPLSTKGSINWLGFTMGNP